jgi:hypothetical protein
MAETIPSPTFDERMQKTLKNAQKWFTDDEHAGAVAGLILGVLFLIFGLCIMLIRENGQVVPAWRKFTGMIVLILGSIAIVTSIGFAVQS